MAPLPNHEDEDETEEGACEELVSSVNEIVETIDKAIGEIEAIDQNELRRRFTKRLEKAEAKLKVAKETLEGVASLAERP